MFTRGRGEGGGELEDALFGACQGGGGAVGEGVGTLFRRGAPVRRVPESAFVEELVTEVERIAEARGSEGGTE